ncbi:MAG: hypothetical protein KGK05_02735 [Xanthomonadaceae bacterium]|nr:hypothetical protein [Xanthomonadaceae bacterium]
MNRFAMFAAVLALAPTAFASAAHAAPAAAKPLVAQTLDSFKQDAARIRKDMLPGGKYGYISATDKSHVEARLTDMQNLLTAHANASDMTQTDKVALFNAQEQINGILDHNDNDRLVCEHVMPVGSHIPVTICHTYAELMARRERTQHDLERNLSTPQHATGN